MQTGQPQSPAPFGQPPSVTPPNPYQQNPSIQSKTSGLAITSLILGLVGAITCGIASIVGLILGIVSFSSIKKSSGRLTGQGLAIAGIIVSALVMIIAPLLMVIAVMIPALTVARGHARATVAASNVHQLCLASVLCAEDNNSFLPDPNNWKQQLTPYLPGNPDTHIKSPYKDVQGCGFAMNSMLIDLLEGQRSPMLMSNIRNSSQVVLFFEAKNNSPAAGGPELFPAEPRGPSGYVIGFLDGHVKNIQPDGLDVLQWAPVVNDAP